MEASRPGWREVGDYVSLGEGSKDSNHNNSNGNHSNEYFLWTLYVPGPELSTLILTVIMQGNYYYSFPIDEKPVFPRRQINALCRTDGK